MKTVPMSVRRAARELLEHTKVRQRMYEAEQSTLRDRLSHVNRQIDENEATVAELEQWLEAHPLEFGADA